MSDDVIDGMAEIPARVMEGPDGLCVTFIVERDEDRRVRFADTRPDALAAELGPAAIVSLQPRRHLTVTLAA